MDKKRTIMDLDNFTYTDADGVVYDWRKMMEISRAYEVMCTAEYINDVYDISIEEAFNASEEIRDVMHDRCECESEIINEFRLDRHWEDRHEIKFVIDKENKTFEFIEGES